MTKTEALKKQVVIVCTECGEELEGEELESPDCFNGDEIICDECYNENHCIHCCTCDEMYPKEEMQQFVLNDSIHDLYGIGGKLQVGFYKIIDKPVFSGNMIIGVNSIWMDAVEFMGKPNEKYFENGGGEGECCKTCMEELTIKVKEVRP